ncbi:unnamed protein product [Adineta steineri]|uniref:Hcy-binding domain-containing protein n=1 Tax=Adineta steineri TaxID=433720 RepID=A0A818WVC3_9BILA|nr:unnamed protein product [Adineta steineri]CAF3730610.1 unnamed protein product [Adineta steineri]
MAKYRKQLPQLSNKYFISNGGLETTLFYKEHVELPCFASFHLLNDESKYQWIKDFFIKFTTIAQKYELGLILDTNTWRASPDWMHKLGYSDQDMININRKAVELLSDIRNEYETEKCPIVINGCIGPRADGYNLTTIMSPEEAQKYHATQISIMSNTKADLITAFTIIYPEEAIGIVRAAKEVNMPIAISFSVETNGKLPTGQTIKEAIELVDKATENTPIYYMINCSHPISFEDILVPGEAWVDRIHGIKGNASKKSHAELDQCKELDDGNPVEFGEHYRILVDKIKNLNILGGCCGTDQRHMEEVCKACLNIINQRQHKDH